jgi:poly-D-alanine transfer protein DltD
MVNSGLVDDLWEQFVIDAQKKARVRPSFLSHPSSGTWDSWTKILKAKIANTLANFLRSE